MFDSENASLFPDSLWDFACFSWNTKAFLYVIDEPDKREEMLEKFHDYQRRADMYFAYHSIQRYTVSLSFIEWDILILDIKKILLVSSGVE